MLLPRPLKRSTHTHHCAAEVRARQEGGRGPGHAAIVNSPISLRLGVPLPSQLIAQGQASLSGQKVFAIKAAHAVSATDGEAVLRDQARLVPLGTNAAQVTQLLFPELQRLHPLHIGVHDLHA